MRPVFAAALSVLLFIQFAYGQGVDFNVSACNCVAFRLDDVQDYFLNQVQMQLIDTFEAKHASLTIGVIGNYTGQDSQLVQFLRQKLHSESFRLDVANHGWNHEDFALLDAAAQSDLMAESNRHIDEVLGVRPSAFIPPFNSMNQDTIDSAARNGLRVVSANITAEHPPFARNISDTQGLDSVFHFPATAKTGDLNADSTGWTGVSHLESMQDIRQSIAKYGYAVVMMHPQEYSKRAGNDFQNLIDPGQLQELGLLLDSAHGEGYSIVTLSELAGSAVPEFAGYPVLYAAFAGAVAAALFFRLKLLRRGNYRYKQTAG